MKGVCIVNNYNGSQKPAIHSIIEQIMQNSPKDVGEFYQALLKKIKGDTNQAFSIKTEEAGIKLSADLQQEVAETDLPYKDQLISSIRENLIDDLKSSEVQITDIQETEGPSMEDNSDMPNEDERNKKTLQDITDTYYKEAQRVNISRTEKFKADLFRIAILDITKDTLVQDTESLNVSICELKNQYFNTIVQYLKNINPDFTSSSMYEGDNYELSENFQKTLNEFYNKLLTTPNYTENILSGWYADMKNSEDSSEDALFYRALNSYINLVYFDEQLQDAVGKVIVVSKKDLKGVDVNCSDLKYKYSNGDEHKRKDFRNSENRDALGDIAKYSKLIIEQIPFRADGRETKRNITLIEFTQTISNLFNYAFRSNDPELREYILKFHSNPRYYAYQIFKKINTANKTFKNQNSGLSTLDKNVLESIGHIAYPTRVTDKNNIYDKELTTLSENFSSLPYSILDCILGVMDRTMNINYYQNIFDSTQNSVVTQIKKKYQDRHSAYATIRKINNSVVTRSQEDRNTLYTRYALQYSMNSQYRKYSIKLGNSRLYIEKNAQDILNSKGTVKEITISDSALQSSLNNLLDIYKFPFDLNDPNKVNSLLRESTPNRGTDEQLFIDILKFIDDYLGLQLYSENGLALIAKLKESTQNHLFLHSLLCDTFKVAVVDNIYREYNDAYKADNTITLKDFIIKQYPPLTNSLSSTQKDSRYKFVGNVIQLTPINSSSAWVDDLNVADALLNGTFSKSTTKDFSGNSLANVRTSFLGGNIHYYLDKYSIAGKTASVSPLLFTPSQGDSSQRLSSQGLIKGYGMNQEISTRTGIKQSVKALKSNSLGYQSIVYNFYNSYYSQDSNLKGTVLIQPTTYSDKTSFLTYAINMNQQLNGDEGKSYKGKTLWELSKDEILDLYIDTIGQAYRNQYNAVVADLKEVLKGLIPELKARGYAYITEDAIQNAQIMELNDFLYQITPQELTNAAQQKGIEIQLDTHYRKVGKTCCFNSLLEYYANTLYTKENLIKRFKSEEQLFVNNLLSTNTQFYLHYFNDPRDSSSHFLEQILKESKVSKADWTDAGTTLVIAKQNGTPLKLGEIATSDIELNPILEKYFYLESLLANNLRLSLTGTEVAHPNKAKVDPSIVPVKQFPELYKQGKLSERAQKDGLYLKSVLNSHKAPSIVYSTIMKAIEVNSQGTQLKRNVIIPATLQYVTQKVIKGVAPKVKVAIIEDTKAPVYNFRGDKDKEDAHDGSAWVNPFTAILENNSLSDQAVGWDKKPIWHHFNPKLMTATLLKFASFAITAERMRMSLQSDLSLYNLFKKMTDIPWYSNGKWNTKNEVPIDLTAAWDLSPSTVAMEEDSNRFFSEILGEKSLYYEAGGKHYQIIDFGKENGVYYTSELEMVGNTSIAQDDNPIKVYHIFDETGHHRYKEKLPDEVLNKINAGTAHTINSLFELYNALGGIYAKELGEKGSLVYSEIASEAVVNFMNIVSYKENNAGKDFHQDNFYQPLKDFMISYAANTSAVKNGASNINASNAWTDNTALKYMELDTDGLGVQMDADHTIDEAELTEFSQVISALEAGGAEHSRAKQVYLALGKLAEECSKLEIDTVSSYISATTGQRQNEVKSDLYDLLGKVLIDAYEDKEGRSGLASVIVKRIKDKFNLHMDHQLDEFLLPFSDNALYNTIISNFVSLINQKSIKRKYPGSGCVMVPGYHIIQTFKYDGKVLMFDDVLKEAQQALTDSLNNQDTIQYNQALVQTYLKQKQQEVYEQEKEQSSDISRFTPTDKVDIIINGNHVYTLDLYNLETYYAFKGYTKNDLEGNNRANNTLNFIRDTFGIQGDISTIEYYTNVTQPKDLAPARISWVQNGHKTNIYDTEEVRKAFLYNIPENERRVTVRKVFNELNKGTYHGQPITDLQNNPAELVMSNLYASTFNAQGKSLAEVLYQEDFGKVNNTMLASKAYDLAFIKNTGRHDYITFSDPHKVKGETIKKLKWHNLKQFKEGSSSELYAVDSNQQKLFKVGKYLYRPDIEYDSKVFKSNGKPIEKSGNLIYDETTKRVVQYIEYVSRYNVVIKDRNGHSRTLTLYYINKDAIRKGLYKPEEKDVMNQLKSILNNIYISSPHQMIQLNKSISTDAGQIVKQIMPSMQFDKRTSDLAKKISEHIDESGVLSKDDAKALKEVYKQEIDKIKEEMKVSFDKALYYTASRIPAQTLQSFMQMKLVGWTQNTKNVAYVSHIQTWLQGSDYRQNCSL